MKIYKMQMYIWINFHQKNMILTKEEITVMLSENGVAANESFSWFGKNPENGETTIQTNQAAYNSYVRHLGSLGIDYNEELDLGQFSGFEAKRIIAVVFKINPENQLLIPRNEFAEFFDIEYDPSKEFVIIKIHYSQQN